MTACKTPLLESLKEDTLAWWAKYLRMDVRIIQKLLDGTGTIHIKTAQKIVDRINEQTGSKFELDVFFNPEELIGHEKERKVIYTYSDVWLSEAEKASLGRYILEKRWHAFSILDVFVFCFLLSIVALIVLYFFL